MKIVVVTLLLIGCQQIYAGGLPASLLSAKAKLAELKDKLDADIAALPIMPLIQPPNAKTALPPINGRVPNFEARKATLETLKAKLTSLCTEQMKAGTPKPEFLAEMQKILEESTSVEMKTFEIPEFKAKPFKSTKLVKKSPIPRMPKVENKDRNVQNFTAEMYRLHGEGTNLHRLMLEDKRAQRNQMTDVIFNVFSEGVQALGSTTEALWVIHRSVQDLIDYDESIGAAADCVNEQKERFAERNNYYGREINFCTRYVVTRSRTYLATVFYPLIEVASLFTSGMQYVILEASSYTNFARDQEALIEFVENELHSVSEVWNNNMLVLFNWEQRRFDDEMLGYQDELDECLGYIERSYDRDATDIKTALESCAVPTRGRPMQLKPTI